MKSFTAKVEICKNKTKKLKITFEGVSNTFDDLNKFEIKSVKDINLEGFELVIIQISHSDGVTINEGKNRHSITCDIQTEVDLENKIALLYNDDKNKGIATPEQSGNGGVVGVISC
ncbi:hypothetical protein [Lacinutrix jangbogonensis]|uniref:hypothetical protein n=1 Tax=Lacinutrix jangbogonensis TaxID=1469557 RepID=UPI00053CFCE2|nr:hypothetical protein [Lacinutrix jangbogonensis]